MNTLILLLVVLGLLSAGLGALLYHQRRETARLQREKEFADEALADARQRLTAAETLQTETRQSRDEAQNELRTLREEHLRTQTELAALRASSTAELAALRQKNAEEREAEHAEREKLEERFVMIFRSARRSWSTRRRSIVMTFSNIVKMPTSFA